MNTLFKSFDSIFKRVLDEYTTKLSTEFDLNQEQLLSLFDKVCKENKLELKVSKKKTTGRKSGYILFSKEERPKIKEEYPDMIFTDVGKELGSRWKSLEDEEKAEWNQKAKEGNQEVEKIKAKKEVYDEAFLKKKKLNELKDLAKSLNIRPGKSKMKKQDWIDCIRGENEDEEEEEDEENKEERPPFLHKCMIKKVEEWEKIDEDEDEYIEPEDDDLRIIEDLLNNEE